MTRPGVFFRNGTTIEVPAEHEIVRDIVNDVVQIRQNVASYLQRVPAIDIRSSLVASAELQSLDSFVHKASVLIRSALQEEPVVDDAPPPIHYALSALLTWSIKNNAEHVVQPYLDDVRYAVFDEHTVHPDKVVASYAHAVISAQETTFPDLRFNRRRMNNLVLCLDDLADAVGPLSADLSGSIETLTSEISSVITPIPSASEEYRMRVAKALWSGVQKERADHVAFKVEQALQPLVINYGHNITDDRIYVFAALQQLAGVMLKVEERSHSLPDFDINATPNTAAGIVRNFGSDYSRAARSVAPFLLRKILADS